VKRDVVVVADDEPSILRAIRRSLRDDFEVVAFESGEEALRRIHAGGVSVVLSDIGMPGMSGLDLLGAIRRHDPDLPVLLITGTPSLDTATQAIKHGVFRYLQKPFEASALISVISEASQRHRFAKLKREASGLQGIQSTPEASSVAGSFQTLLQTISVNFQPIVSMSARRVFGYEALMRNSAPDFPSPGHMLAVAERARAVHELGRTVRRLAAGALNEAPEGTLLFVNLHPHDLLDPELVARDSPLASSANRVVLEITERAPLQGIADVGARIAALQQLGFRIAVDDLGAGYAGLTSFVMLKPDIVKLDMSLIRAIDQSTVKQKLVASLSALCREVGVALVIEGVETMGECRTLLALGCDLLQGYLFGCPEPRPRVLRW
jgi:EAL domain-containing protein (putative c-di-GMP-specific phosphodiesterase class I)